MEHDCELEMDTDEVEFFLENGDPHKDMDKALNTLQELATKRKGKATCLFTVHYKEPADEEQD
jgi:uncharacterized protein Smg (DUF494 family)